LGSVWNYNWRHLTTNASCHLQAMLLSMTAAAIPPGIITKHMDVTLMKSSQTTTHPPVRKMLVRGHYQERLNALLQQSMTGVVLSSMQEQELITLLGLKMSERYREIVLLLYTNPLLSTNEVAILNEQYVKTTNRYVLTLEQWGCIEHAFPKQSPRETVNPTQLSANENERQPMGSHDRRWVLSIRGLRYLAASMNVAETTVIQRQIHTRDVQQATPRVTHLQQLGVGQLSREWSHTTGVYQCITGFYRAAALQPGHTIAWFEAHFRCARRYRANGIWHNFRPDAVLEYVVKREGAAQHFHLWIEWDSGTMGSQALREKMQTYHRYIRSLEWRRRTSTEAAPLLLIIVPHRSQHNRMTHVVQEVFHEPKLHVRITSQELLREDGPLAKIWTVVIPIPPEHASRLRFLLDMDGAEPITC
jgi:Replication-relaxation